MCEGEIVMAIWGSKYAHKFLHLKSSELIELRKDPTLSPAVKGVLTRLLHEKTYPTTYLQHNKTSLQILAMALNRYKGAMKWFELATQDFLQASNTELRAVKDLETRNAMVAASLDIEAALLSVRKASAVYGKITTLCPEKRKHVKKPS
jgi:hypothetical protein